MDEEKARSNQKTNSSPTHRRRGSNRSLYNNWASQRGRGASLSTSQQNIRDNSLLPLQDSSSDNDIATAANPHSNASGLNGIRQLIDSIDDDFVEVDATTSASFNADIPTASNIHRNSTRDEINGDSTDERNEGSFMAAFQRPPRVRARRRATRNSEASRSGTNSDVGRTTQPPRQGRYFPGPSPRVPPLCFSSNPSNPMLQSPQSPVSTDQESPHGLYTLFGPMGLPGGYSGAIISGLGTEEEPFELSPGLPDVPSSPSAFRDSGDSNSFQSDEEIARQLQQEEWEVVSNLGNGENRSRSPWPAVFHYPHRSRPVDLPPLRGRRGSQNSGVQPIPFSGHSYPARSNRGNFGSRPPGRSTRGQGFNIGHVNDVLQDADMAFSPDGEIALIIDLMTSYGLSPNQIQSMLFPGPVGSRPRTDAGTYESLLALAEELGEVSRGISQSEINKIPTSKHKSSEVEKGASAVETDPAQCHICLSEYENGDEKRNLMCKHDFHKTCVDQWLKTNATCPVCRSEVKPKRS